VTLPHATIHGDACLQWQILRAIMPTAGRFVPGTCPVSESTAVVPQYFPFLSLQWHTCSCSWAARLRSSMQYWQAILRDVLGFLQFSELGWFFYLLKNKGLYLFW